MPLAVLIYFCPESPRWYMKKGRMQDAWKSMRKIRHTELQAARDLYYAYVQFMEESKVRLMSRAPAERPDHPGQDICLAIHRALHDSPLSPRQLCCFGGHASTAALRNQHHGVLQVSPSLLEFSHAHSVPPSLLREVTRQRRLCMRLSVSPSVPFRSYSDFGRFRCG